MLGSSLSGSSTLPVSSSSKCAKCTVGFFRRGWLPSSFLMGKKLVILDLGRPSAVWVLGPWGSSIESSLSASLAALGSLSMSSPADLPSGRLPLLLITWEVCHRSDPSSTLPHDLGENDQGKKWLKPGVALKGKHPSPTLIPYPPSIIGIAPGSAHQALSHCYKFIQYCQHIIQCYIHTRPLYQFSGIALQGSYCIG